MRKARLRNYRNSSRQVRALHLLVLGSAYLLLLLCCTWSDLLMLCDTNADGGSLAKVTSSANYRSGNTDTTMAAARGASTALHRQHWHH
eukprot:14300-Heterococcus_DN1.PRE.3